MKVLNTMRAFADQEGKLAFDNMIHELAQTRIQVERIIKQIEELEEFQHDDHYEYPSAMQADWVLRLLKSNNPKPT